jgi:hypothetical protein
VAPYNQREKDPESFYLSIAVICGLATIGAAMASQIPLAICAGAGAVYCWCKSSASKA